MPTLNLPHYFHNKQLHCAGVYAITCGPTGKVYVGSAVDMFTRWRQHYYHLALDSHHCIHLQSAWRKYGSEAFMFSVIEFTTHEELRAREQADIDSVHVRARFNSTPTAGSLLGFKMSPESLERMRVAHTGFRHSEETKAGLSQARKGIAPRPVGWKMTEEGKSKLRGPRNPLSPEHRAIAITTLRCGGPWTEKRKLEFSISRKKLTDTQVASAREQYLSGEPFSKIGHTMGCSITAVTNAVRGVGIYGTIGIPVTEKIDHSLSEDHKKQISAFHKGRAKSTETRARMSAFQKGRPKSEQARQNMRAAREAKRKATQCDSFQIDN